jgi:hypothetical protein
MKGIYRACQYLAYYSILSRTMKRPTKMVSLVINGTLFISFRVYQISNPTSNLRCKKFHLEVARDRVNDEPE